MGRSCDFAKSASCALGQLLLLHIQLSYPMPKQRFGNAQTAPSRQTRASYSWCTKGAVGGRCASAPRFGRHAERDEAQVAPLCCGAWRLRRPFQIGPKLVFIQRAAIKF